MSSLQLPQENQPTSTGENQGTTTIPVNSNASADASYIKQHGLLLINDNNSIYTVHADSSGKTLLTSDGMTPSWTPDGKIIFVSHSGGRQHIELMDKDGSNAHEIGNRTPNMAALFPQIATNGLMAFQAGECPDGNNNGIWVTQSDGSGLKQVACGTQPSLARSGTWISYTHETDNPYLREIWRINTDGSNNKQLTFLGDPDYPDANAANISPDEQWVAFFSGKESDKGAAGARQDPSTWGHRNVAVVPAAGGARRTLTACKPVQQAAPGDCIAADNPAWSPDSKWIMHDTDKPGIWMIDINGQNEQLLYGTGRGPVHIPLTYLP
jgi:Tol biopolymer transport system component